MHVCLGLWSASYTPQVVQWEQLTFDLTRLYFCNTYYLTVLIGLVVSAGLDRGTSFSIRYTTTTGQSRLSIYPIFTALTHKRFILRRSRCAAMIRLIRLDSGTQPWLLVLVLTAHNRSGRSCQQSGRSLCHNMPNSDWLLFELDLVLVLTARNRGGRSCQQPGRSIYRSNV